jgi:hypothetical protein
MTLREQAVECAWHLLIIVVGGVLIFTLGDWWAL